MPVGQLRAVARLRDLRSTCLLYSDDYGVICVAADSSGGGAALQSVWVSCAAGAIYRDGAMDLCSAFAVQTSVYVAGPDDRSTGYSCLPGVDADGCCDAARVETVLRKWRISINGEAAGS